jgi:hypothetical protein
MIDVFDRSETISAIRWRAAVSRRGVSGGQRNLGGGGREVRRKVSPDSGDGVKRGVEEGSGGCFRGWVKG